MSLSTALLFLSSGQSQPLPGARTASPTAQRAAPPYVPPPAVVTDCANEIVNRLSQHVLGNSNDAAYTAIGGGAVARGPLGEGERHVFVYLPNREIRVDAQTGMCTRVRNGRTLRRAIEESFDRAMYAYRLWVPTVLTGERSTDEGERADARRRRAGLSALNAFLLETLATCEGNGTSRVSPDWLRAKVESVRTALAGQNRSLGQPPAESTGEAVEPRETVN